MYSGQYPTVAGVWAPLPWLSRHRESAPVWRAAVPASVLLVLVQALASPLEAVFPEASALAWSAVFPLAPPAFFPVWVQALFGEPELAGLVLPVAFPWVPPVGELALGSALPGVEMAAEPALSEAFPWALPAFSPVEAPVWAPVSLGEASPAAASAFRPAWVGVPAAVPVSPALADSAQEPALAAAMARRHSVSLRAGLALNRVCRAPAPGREASWVDAVRDAKDRGCLGAKDADYFPEGAPRRWAAVVHRLEDEFRARAVFDHYREGANPGKRADGNRYCRECRNLDLGAVCLRRDGKV